MSIKENFQKIRSELPKNVTLVVAVKQRTLEEVKEAIIAGATDIGENYVQEGEEIFKSLESDIREKVKWHMIGHLQKNKINRALKIFDVVQTIDSFEKAEATDKRVTAAGKDFVSVYIEINVGNELSKSGLKPDYGLVENLIEKISKLEHVKTEGIMTMGPRFDDYKNLRPYFRKTRKIFDKVRCLNLPNVDMKVLSMGMSDSYKIAIDEGANMVRIGTAIFGSRKYKYL